MLINESPAGTAADSITKDEDLQFSQHSSKPLCCAESLVWQIIKFIF